MTRLRVVDFETNGTEPPAEVIEVGVCDLVRESPDGEWIVGKPTSRLYKCDRLDPVARAVHHIAPSEIAASHPFDLGDLLAYRMDDGIAAFVAHNWSFEGQWLTEETIQPVRSLCTYKGALRTWPDAPSHSNGALRYWLEDQGLIAPDPTLCQPAHRAGPDDAYVTAHILKALLTMTTGREMIAWTREPACLPRCPICKFRGKPWPEVEGGFLDWMTRQADMESDLKRNAQRELERRRIAA
jgi:exodeoxyribonuclease X